MARGRVRLRRTSPQMTFLHEVIFAQRALACWLFEKSSQPNQRYDSVKLSLKANSSVKRT